MSEQTSILDTLTDDERQAAEAFVRDQRAAQQRTKAGKALVDDFIAGRNERETNKANALANGTRWYSGGRLAIW